MIEPLDWVVIGVYLAILLWLGFYLAKGQKSEKDYFLGGRNIPSWAIAMSTTATQCGAISMMSIPAFVALASGGGMKWLQLELAVPLAVILVMSLIIPTFYRSKITTAYEYLERRFSPATRSLISFMFLLSRGLATGCAIYAPSFLLSTITGFSIVYMILLMSAVTMIYTAVGGIKASIYTDVLQFILLSGSVLILIAVLFDHAGFSSIVASIPKGRALGVDFIHTGFDGYDYAFLPAIIGGIFFYSSYYGLDQSQIQRVLTSKSVDASRSALFLNCFLRYPLMLGYCILGIFLRGFLSGEQSLLQAVVIGNNPDALLPLFISMYLPAGLRGLIIVGILAGAMSTLDSSYNSLSAATMNDFYTKYIKKEPTAKEYLLWSRLTTLGWAIFCMIFAFFAGRLAETIIVGVNKIGAVFYGPILGAFLLGILTKRARGYGVIAGVLAGVVFNAYLWFYQPQISWLWWSAIGFLVTFSLGYSLSLTGKIQGEYKVVKSRDKRWSSKYTVLLLYFVVIVLISYLFNLFLFS